MDFLGGGGYYCREWNKNIRMISRTDGRKLKVFWKLSFFLSFFLSWGTRINAMHLTMAVKVRRRREWTAMTREKKRAYIMPVSKAINFIANFFAWNQWNDFFSLLLLFIFFEGKEENVLDRCWTRYRSHVREIHKLNRNRDVVQWKEKGKRERNFRKLLRDGIRVLYCR